MFKTGIRREELYRKIRVMANKTRFRMLELTQNGSKTVTELSRETNLAYNKCADYVTMLEKEGLVEKRRDGREMLVKANINLDKVKMD
ncbi:MAG: winged helix-turn-helix domain-containing protein [Candidatus Diapherotrites archaeon]